MCQCIFSGLVVFLFFFWFWLFTEFSTEGRIAIIHCVDSCAPAGHSSLHRHRQRGGKEGQVLHRSKRGWVWNQFFVIEEYTGPDPVLVGRVSPTEHWLSRTKTSQTEPIWLPFILMYFIRTYAGKVIDLGILWSHSHVAVQAFGT